MLTRAQYYDVTHPSGQEYLLNGECISKCPADGYTVGGSRATGFVCDRCHASCRTCHEQKANFCLTCWADAFLHEVSGKCAASCNKGHQAALATPIPTTTTKVSTPAPTAVGDTEEKCKAYARSTDKYFSRTTCSARTCAPQGCYIYAGTSCNVDELKIGWVGPKFGAADVDDDDANMWTFASFDTADARFGKQTVRPKYDMQIQMANPRDGCSTLSNEMPDGGIMLIERGECTFVSKAEHGQATGADFVVIFNSKTHHEAGDYVTGMSCPEGQCTGISIPVISLDHAAGSALEAVITNNNDDGYYNNNDDGFTASIFCDRSTVYWNADKTGACTSVKECIDFSKGTPDMYCDVKLAGHDKYSSLESAQKACTGDLSCVAVADGQCDGGTFTLCESVRGSTKGSCVWDSFPPAYPAPICNKCQNQFMCLSGSQECVSKNAVCNNIPDCKDGSDEALCTEMYKAHDATCGESTGSLETPSKGPPVLGMHGGSCNECSPGTFSPIQHSFAQCQECLKGTYEENTGSTKCTPCPKGTATTERKSTSASACEDCPPGSAQSVEGGECILCNAGTFNKDSKRFGHVSEICKLCNINEFQPSDGQAACISCPRGQYQPNIGQSSCLECDDACNECHLSSDVCVSCNPPFFLKWNQSCVDRSECGGKEYEDLTSRTCRDHTAPIFPFGCTRNQTRYAWGPNQNGTVVDWPRVEVFDDTDTNVTAVPTHKPGGWFLIGTTQVSYVARDSAGNVNSCEFQVHVIHGNRTSCPDAQTRKRRAEEESRLHQFSADIDVYDKATNRKLKLKSKGEYAHGLITLTSHDFVEHAVCSETGLILTLGLGATMDEQEQVLHEWSDRSRIIAVEGAWGCNDETGKPGPVYRRINVGGIVALSTHPLQVQVETTNATFVDCFRHADFDFDYFPGNASASTTAANHDDARPSFKNNGVTPLKIQAERHRNRNRRAWGLAWEDDDKCFLNLCRNVGQNWDFKKEKPINPTLVLTNAPQFKVKCHNCYAFIEAGVRLKYSIQALRGSMGLVPELKHFSLSIYGKARAEMRLDADLFYNRYAYETTMYDTSDNALLDHLMTVEQVIPVIPGVPRQLIGLKFEASLSLQLLGRIEIDVDGEGKLETRLDFERNYEKGFAWTPERGFYTIAPQPIKKSTFEVLNLQIPKKVRVRIYPIIPAFTLELGGFLTLLMGLVDGGITVPIQLRLEPYFELEQEPNLESQCELQVSTYYGINYRVYVRGIFATFQTVLMTKPFWEHQLIGSGWNGHTGAILPRKEIATGTLGCKQKIEYAWKTGEWSQCLSNEQSRIVMCADKYDGAGPSEADFYCKSVRPQSTKPCVFDCYLIGCKSGDCMGNGKCQCEIGWAVARGQSDTGQCIRPICENTCINGVCSAPDTCTCDEGWSGKSCAVKLDVDDLNCPTASKCVNGYGCAVANGGCSCHRGWSHAASGTCTVQLAKCSSHVSPPYKCMLCTSDSTQCADCHSGFVLVAGTCESSSSISNVSSMVCDQTCKTCARAKSRDSCTSCRDGFFIFGGRCLEGKCPDGLIGDRDNIGKCTFCDASCKLCSSTTAVSCTACNDGLFLLNVGESGGGGTCVNECPSETYWSDIATATCKPCNAACAKCSGPTENDCSSCPSDDKTTALYQGACVRMPCPSGTMLSSPSATSPSWNTVGNVCLSNAFNGPEPSCSHQDCPLHWRGDNECDDECNTEACNYDRGDCNNDQDFCAALGSCNNCQSYAGCGWCESTMQCHSSSDDNDASNPSTHPACPAGLLHHSCTAIAVEPQLQFFGDLQIGSEKVPTWNAGAEYFLKWTGGSIHGSVQLKFTTEDDQNNHMEASVFNSAADKALPNTGVLHVIVPDRFPATCQLQFMISSMQDGSNVASSSHIIVKRSALEVLPDVRPAELLLTTWSARAWGQCSQTCGSGSQTREVKCLNILGGAEMSVTDCESKAPTSVQTCNVHRCPISALQIVHPKHATIWHSDAPYDISIVGGEDYQTLSMRVRKSGGAWQPLACNTTAAISGLLIADATLINGMLVENVTVELEVEVSIITDVRTETVQSGLFGLCNHVGPEGQCIFVDLCELKQPCQNGGTCINTPSSFVCTCQAGFEGPTCAKYEDNVDCDGGGVFQDLAGSCVCPADTVCSNCTSTYDQVTAQWQYYYSPNCVDCKCVANSKTVPCDPVDCGGMPATFCKSGKCECIKGYRKRTEADNDNDCILDIQLEPVVGLWEIGKEVLIRWTAADNSPMRIELFRPGYGHFTVAASVPNSGNFKWKVPHVLSEGSYRLSVTADFDWRSTVGTHVELLFREEDAQPCCIAAPTATDYVQAGSLTRVVWTPAKTKDTARRTRSIATSLQLDLLFESNDAEITTIASGIDDTGSIVVQMPAMHVFEVSDQPFLKGRFLLSSEFNKTYGEVLLVDRPPMALQLLNMTGNKAFQHPIGDVHEVLWTSTGLVKAPCDESAACQLSIYTILDGVITSKIEVPNNGSYLLPMVVDGPGRLEIRIVASTYAHVWDQQFRGYLPGVPPTYAPDAGVDGGGAETTKKSIDETADVENDDKQSTDETTGAEDDDKQSTDETTEVEDDDNVTGVPPTYSPGAGVDGSSTETAKENIDQTTAVDDNGGTDTTSGGDVRSDEAASSMSKSAGVVGGALGGIIAVVLIACAVLWIVKSRRGDEPNDDSIGDIELHAIPPEAPQQQQQQQQLKIQPKRQKEELSVPERCPTCKVKVAVCTCNVRRGTLDQPKGQKAKRQGQPRKLRAQTMDSKRATPLQQRERSTTMVSPAITQMCEHTWFVGSLEKAKCKALVATTPAVKGSFLVRNSTRHSGSFVMCVNHGDGKVQEDLVTLDSVTGRLSVKFCDIRFNSIEEFVNYWQSNMLSPQRAPALLVAFKLNDQNLPGRTELQPEQPSLDAWISHKKDAPVAKLAQGSNAGRERADTMFVKPIRRERSSSGGAPVYAEAAADEKAKKKDWSLHSESSSTSGSLPLAGNNAATGPLTVDDIGARVTVDGYDCKGTLKFVGPHHEKGTPRCGVQLDEPVGKSRGSFGGHVYFEAPKKTAVLVPVKKVTRVVRDRTSTLYDLAASGTNKPVYAEAVDDEGADYDLASNTRVTDYDLASGTNNIVYAEAAEDEGTDYDLASSGNVPMYAMASATAVAPTTGIRPRTSSDSFADVVNRLLDKRDLETGNGPTKGWATVKKAIARGNPVIKIVKETDC